MPKCLQKCDRIVFNARTCLRFFYDKCPFAGQICIDIRARLSYTVLNAKNTEKEFEILSI